VVVSESVLKSMVGQLVSYAVNELGNKATIEALTNAMLETLCQDRPNCNQQTRDAWIMAADCCINITNPLLSQ
jgi:hypothetical protein